MGSLKIDELKIIKQYFENQNIVDTRNIIDKYNLPIDVKKCDDTMFMLYNCVCRELERRGISND